LQGTGSFIHSYYLSSLHKIGSHFLLTTHPPFRRKFFPRAAGRPPPPLLTAALPLNTQLLFLQCAAVSLLSSLFWLLHTFPLLYVQAPNPKQNTLAGELHFVDFIPCSQLFDIVDTCAAR
jgi:hypothetical protein